MRPSGLRPKGSPATRDAHARKRRSNMCMHVCTCVSLCTHVCICVHARPRERTHVLASARACPGTGAYVHTRGHASSGARTNEPNEVWSRPRIMCAHTNEPFTIWSRPQITRAYMCVVSLYAHYVYATHTHVYRRARPDGGSPVPTRVHTRAHEKPPRSPKIRDARVCACTCEAHAGTHIHTCVHMYVRT
jgi:hypothetical protein